MRTSSDKTGYAFAEPEITPSILAAIPDTLRAMLETSVKASKQKRRSFLISSNSLANRFIIDRWRIRPSQRRRFKNLFTAVRTQCRNICQYYLTKGRMDWESKGQNFSLGVYKFDKIRRNLILGFVEISPDSEWLMPTRPNRH